MAATTSSPAPRSDSVIKRRTSLSSSMTRTRRFSRRCIYQMLTLRARKRQRQAQKRALYAPEQICQGNIQAFGEMSERREGRRDAPCFHLPDVLALEVDDALRARTELRHREALLLTERA